MDERQAGTHMDVFGSIHARVVHSGKTRYADALSRGQDPGLV